MCRAQWLILMPLLLFSAVMMPTLALAIWPPFQAGAIAQSLSDLGDTLISEHESSFCLTVNGAGTALPAISVTTCRATANQRWQRDESGLWHTDLDPAYCLATRPDAPDGTLSVLPCDDEHALHFVQDGDDPIYLVEGTNQALTFSFEDGGDGPALLYRRHGDAQQRWYWTQEDEALLQANADYPVTYPFPADDTLAWELEAAKDRIARRQPPADPQFTRDPSIYPGMVPANAPTVTRRFAFPLAFKDHDYLRMFVAPENWLSTGLYAPAGTILKVTVSNTVAADDMDLYLRIGPHIDVLNPLTNNDVKVRGEVIRYPNMSVLVRLLPGENLVRSPYGGLLLLVSPQSADTTVQVEIAGAVEAPRFVLSQTTAAQWAQSSTAPAPWGEIEGERAVVMAPVADLRPLTFAEVTQLATFYDTVVRLHNELAGLGDERPLPDQSPQGKYRFLTDQQIIDLGAHNGFPAMFSHKLADPTLVTGYTNTGLGIWHELGHNYQQPFWDDLYDSEATTDLFALYAEEQLFGTSFLQAMGYEQAALRFLSDPAQEQKWQAAGIMERLVFLNQLKHRFGWSLYQQVRQRYRAMSAAEVAQVNRDEQTRRDTFFLLLCAVSGYNLTPHFERWTVAISAAAKADPTCQKRPFPEVDISTLSADVHDLALRLKLASGQPALFTPGQAVRLHLDLVNQGPTPVRDIALATYLPAGFHLSNNDANGWHSSGYRYVRLVADQPAQAGSKAANAAEIGVLRQDGTPIDQANWKISYVDSQYFGELANNRRATNAIDGNEATFWQTDWEDAALDYPHEVQIDLGAYYPVGGFTYLPANADPDSWIGEYRFFVSIDGAEWTAVAQGAFANDATAKRVDFTAPPRQAMVTTVLAAPLAPGATASTDLLLETDAGLAPGAHELRAEITAVRDNLGNLGQDLDSTADADPANDPVVDDALTFSALDEDDHDVLCLQITRQGACQHASAVEFYLPLVRR